ncbi:MAG TPA: manganese efflux pump [Thermomicrobiales bacterium]|nr:manganese efflux pump [Thermomicrobiales bacterium]
MEIVWFLIVIPLGIDLFAAGLVFGLSGLPRERWMGTSLLFAVIGAGLLGLGALLGQALSGAAGAVAAYVAGIALLAIGLKTLAQGIKEGRAGERKATPLDAGKVTTTGIVVAVDKFAVGLSLAILAAPVGPLIIFVAVQSFAVTLLGLTLGRRLGGRVEGAAEIIGGLVFAGLGLLVLIKTAGSAG